MVVILDTTLREGELHPGVYYTAEARKTIGLALAEVGTPRIEFPIVHPSRGGLIQDIKSVIEAVRESYGNVELIVQCRALREDIENAANYNADGCGVFLAATQEHRMAKFGGLSRDEATRRFVEAIELLKSYGFKYRRAVIEDASRFFTAETKEEDTLQFLFSLVKSVYAAGATVVSIPDTSGISIHRSISDIIQTTKKETNAPLAGHFHNDYGNSLPNAIEAVLAGVDEIHVSIYGLGSRNGITDHYELVANLEDLYGVRVGERRSGFMNLYQTFHRMTGIPIPWRHPLSSLARTEKAGTHQAQVVLSPVGYVPRKKFEHDFRGQASFEAGQLMSKRVVDEILKNYDVGEEVRDEIVVAVAERSALKARKLSPMEVGDIIEAKSGISIPRETIARTIRGLEYAYLLIKLRPQYPVRRIMDEVSGWDEVERVDEVYGDVDMVLLTQLRDLEGKDVVDKIRKKFSEGIIDIAALILE